MLEGGTVVQRMLLAAISAVALVSCEGATEPITLDRSAGGADLATVSVNARTAATPTILKVKQVSRGESQIVGWCDQAGGVVLAAAPGTGTFTHVGQFEIQQHGCINLGTGVISAGEATMTAANGDELYLTYEGRVLPGIEPQTMELFYVRNGGTGRFTHGEGEMSVIVTYTTPTTWVSTGQGWISYTASDRSQ
jgi:hypothetical protein